MASIVNDPNGFRRVQFVDGSGKRRSIRLGKCSRRDAEKACGNIETLLAAKRTGNRNVEAEEWANGLGPLLRKRLEAAGLVGPNPHRHVTLGEVLEEYFANLEVGPGTYVTYGQTRKNLEEYFGPTTPSAEIGPLEAERWKQAMLADGLAASTVAKRVRQARTIFKHALRWKMVTSNPFAEVKGGGMTNRARMFYVTRDMANAVLGACPNNEWKLIFALSWFGGLRCPSEHALLKWEDVDWERSRIRIHSPKTERHGGDHRYIPIFPELRPLLLKQFEDAEPGSTFVVPRVQDGAVNLRTRMLRIVKRAGLNPWPKLFHNLRSTRQTELAQSHPAHVVCSWLGNSPAVAAAHYLQVTESDFERAAQIPAQYPPERGGIGKNETNPKNENRPVLPSDSVPCLKVPEDRVTRAGFEPA